MHSKLTITPRSRKIAFKIFVAVALCSLQIVSADSGSDKCATEKSSLYCPNCGGIEVSDCSKCEGYLFTDSQHEICYDRKLFNVGNHAVGDPDNHYPFLWNDIVGAIVWFFTAGIATACGVGGGGIYVPLGILLLRFSPKAASGLSQASIFGASLGGLIVNIRNHHPNEHVRDTKGSPLEGHPGKIVPHEKDLTKAEIEEDRKRYLEGGDGKRKFYTRPVIDYDMALFLAPMEMAGAVLGVIIQKLFPNWLFLTIAALVLAFTSYKTYVKFFATYKKEKAARAEMHRRETMAESKHSTLGADDEADATATEACDVTNEDSTAIAVDGFDSDKAEAEDDPKDLEMRRHFLEIDSRQYPKEKLAYLVLLWVGLTIIILLKGGKGVESVIGVTCEDAGYYALVAGQFIWTMGFAAFFGIKNVMKTNERLAVNYPFNDMDILWDYKKLQFYSFFTFLAGIIAGLIGVGGGMVLGPLMIAMEVNPRVSTSTTATMVLLTSSSVAVIFVMSGLVPWEYALFFFLVCLCGAYIGKTKIDAYVKRTGMASILIGILATIIALATIGCIVNLFMGLASVNWCLAGFNQFCTVSSGSGSDCAARLLEAHDLFPEAQRMFPF